MPQHFVNVPAQDQDRRIEISYERLTDVLNTAEGIYREAYRGAQNVGNLFVPSGCRKRRREETIV